jgi:hypothetical protein
MTAHVPATVERRKDLPTALATLTTHHVARSGNVTRLLDSLNGHQWFSEPEYDKALSWCTAARAARNVNEFAFFVNAIVDAYRQDVELCAHYRAMRATKIHNLPEPIKLTDVPSTKTDGRHKYDLQWKPLMWIDATPHDAVTAVSDVLQQTPPNEFRIAEYVRHVQRPVYWDPIIYAVYGPWCVEVAQWD